MTKRPHVLVLLCDQMQHSRMGVVDGVAHTPNLDALAAEGIRFTNAFTCHAQCMPSRASFQTGLYPHECGVMTIRGFGGHQNRLSPRHQTLGHAFAQAGYRTVYFGKMHQSRSLSELGYAEGAAWDVDGHPVDEQAIRRHHLADVPAEMHENYVLPEHAAEFLRRYQPDGRSLFFTFSTNLPHPPFYFDPRHGRRFDPAAMKLPESFYAETFAGKPSFQREHAEDGKHGLSDESHGRQMLAKYYSMIAAMDEHLGQVIEQFKRLNIWDDTLVLFTSDHGDMMGAHRMRLKGTLPYDELYRVPLLMKLPGGRGAGRVVEPLTSSIQCGPTLLKAAGVGIPDQFHHGDFHHLLTDESEADAATVVGTGDDEQPVFFEHYAAYWGLHPLYGIRTRQWKYVRYYGEDARDVAEELYHLAADPHELHNVAGRPEHADVRQRLARQADDWWRGTGGRDIAYYESDHFRNNHHNA